MNLRDALSSVARQLKSETANLDAQVLLGNILGRPRTWVLSHPEIELTPDQIRSVEHALARLLAGEPLAYVLGQWEFFSLKFEVSPHVLIPRPETELLVEHAISWLRANPEQRSMLEIGTGSGCIAVSIAVHIQNLHVIASDISFQALSLARRNAIRHNVNERINFLQADLFSSFSTSSFQENKFALICSNPPYIPTERLKSLPVFNREPTSSLNGGVDGLTQITGFLRGASDWLSKPGLLLVEMDYLHADTLRSLALDLYKGASIQVLKDLSGKDRLLSVAC
jgi:release factor glutamine methyltransferase